MSTSGQFKDENFCLFNRLRMSRVHLALHPWHALYFVLFSTFSSMQFSVVFYPYLEENGFVTGAHAYHTCPLGEGKDSEGILTPSFLIDKKWQ